MGRHLSFANVVSCLALFIALGGTSYAVATGSIGTKAIKNNSVRSTDVRNGTLKSRDVARGSLGGRAIKESTLGRVPGASRVGGKTAEDLRVRCPAGTQPQMGSCIELSVRPARPYGLATTDCEFAKRRLPTYQELASILDDSATITPGGELTAEVYPGAGASDPLNALSIVSPGGRVALVPDTFAGRRSFRCVATPSN